MFDLGRTFPLVHRFTEGPMNFKETQHATHFRHPIKCGNDVHFRGAGICKARFEVSGNQRANQTFCTVHIIWNAPPPVSDTNQQTILTFTSTSRPRPRDKLPRMHRLTDRDADMDQHVNGIFNSGQKQGFKCSGVNEAFNYAGSDMFRMSLCRVTKHRLQLQEFLEARFTPFATVSRLFVTSEAAGEIQARSIDVNIS